MRVITGKCMNSISFRIDHVWSYPIFFILKDVFPGLTGAAAGPKTEEGRLFKNHVKCQNSQ